MLGSQAKSKNLGLILPNSAATLRPAVHTRSAAAPSLAAGRAAMSQPAI